MGGYGSPPPRIVIGHLRPPVGGAPNCRFLSGLSDRRPHADTLRHHAGLHQLLQRDQEFAGERRPREGGDHGFAGGAAAVLRALAEPFDQRAVWLVAQEAPGELDQRPPYSGIAGLGEACSRRLLPLSSGAPVTPAYRATARRSRKFRDKASRTISWAVATPTL